MRFHMTHVTKEFHQVRPKWFSNLWYVQCKPCTYLVLRSALSPNRPKQTTTWASSPRSTIRCVQADFWAYGMFAQTVQLSNIVSKWTKMRFHMTHVSYEFYRVCTKQLPSIWYVRRKPCTYPASWLALSPNGPKRASTWASSPRSTIRCVQNYFYAFGTFGTYWRTRGRLGGGVN